MKQTLLGAAALVAAFFATPAAADVTIDVYRETQTMQVVVDGALAYVWPVSTGAKDRWTPPGTFGVQSLSEHHRSSIYNNAPMPHSIFFNGNIAIHGTTEEANLGNRASHGCVRLARINAATLFALVRADRAHTRVTVH